MNTCFLRAADDLCIRMLPHLSAGIRRIPAMRCLCAHTLAHCTKVGGVVYAMCAAGRPAIQEHDADADRTQAGTQCESIP